MKILLLVVGLVINLFSNADTSPIFISLGGDCEIAWRLRQNNLRENAFPFDWLKSYDFAGVCKALQEKFSHFLNPDYLVHMGIIKNTRYAFEFLHDFPTTNCSNVALENENDGIVSANYLEYLPQVQDKYQRRIDRLIEIIKSGQHIIFLRTDITPVQATNFVNMMTNIYPEARYQLFVLHNNTKYNYPWNIPQVTSWYADKSDTTEINGWYQAHYWSLIFKYAMTISN